MFRRKIALEIWEGTKPDEMVADWPLLLGLGIRDGALVSACDGCAYTKLAHSNSLSTRITQVTRCLAEVCERIAGQCGNPTDRRALLLRAKWERVTLARHFAAFGELGKCRAELWHCIRKYPLHLPAWRQRVQSFVLPGRMIRIAREQRKMERAVS